MEDEVAQLKAYIKELEEKNETLTKELEEKNETLTKEYHKLSDDYDDLLNDFEMLDGVFSDLYMEG